MSNETSVSVKTFSRFEHVAIIVLSIGLFILPLLFIPSPFVLFEFLKITTLVVVVCVAALLVICARLQDRKMTISKSPLVWSLWALPVIYGISALASAHPTTGLVGYGFEVGTFGFVLTLTTLTALVAYLFRSTGRSLSLLAIILSTPLILGLFHALRFGFGPTFLSMGVFTDITHNTFGKWYDLSILFGFGTITALILLTRLTHTIFVRIVLYILLLVSLCMLVTVNSFMVWVMVAIFAIGFALYQFFSRLTSSPDSETTTPVYRKVPYLAVAVLLVSVFFILDNLAVFSTQPFTARVTEKLAISQVEVRPSWTSTGEIVVATLKVDPVFGVGPNRFSSAWNANKPQGINAWPFWNVDFSYGIGFVPTALITTGIVGALDWAVFLVFLVASMVRVLRKPAGDARGRGVTLALLFATAFLWVSMVIYVPGILAMVLTFAVTGLYFAALSREGVIQSTSMAMNSRSLATLFTTLGFVAALIALVTLGYVYLQKSVASYHFRKGATAFGANDPVAGEQHLVKAFKIGQNDLYLRAIADFYVAQLVAMLNTDLSSAKAEEVRAQFETLFRFANTAANQAVAYDATNYQNYLTRARVYELVIPLNIPNAYESAKADYAEAVKRNSQNPLIYLLTARLEATAGNIALAKEAVQVALSLKPDYEDAKTFLAEINKVRPQSSPTVSKDATPKKK